MQHIIKIKEIRHITHDVKSLTLTKPENYEFIPGQAAEVAINQPNLKEETRPFTFTSLNSDPDLEFIIKGYFDHEGITKKIHSLKVADELVIGEPWGAISYQGPGVFIAGGAGITPFIAIFRDLHVKENLMGNSLIFSNKTSNDVILEKELREFFPETKNLILTLTNEQNDNYEHGLVDENFIKAKIINFTQKFYVCGPPAMVKSIKETLTNLGAQPEAVVFEK